MRLNIYGKFVIHGQLWSKTTDIITFLPLYMQKEYYRRSGIYSRYLTDFSVVRQLSGPYVRYHFRIFQVSVHLATVVACMVSITDCLTELQRKSLPKAEDWQEMACFDEAYLNNA